MRSRYSAYALNEVPYIVETNDPETRADIDEAGMRDWAERTKWLKLDVLTTRAGGEQDDEGEVEFVAHFRDERGRELRHHERASFVRRDDRWYFHDGYTPKSAPVTRDAPKVGRNDPCPCGSGKKHKKCCAARAR